MPKESADAKLLEESVHEANAVNSGIEGLDLNAPDAASRDDGSVVANGGDKLASSKENLSAKPPSPDNDNKD